MSNKTPHFIIAGSFLCLVEYTHLIAEIGKRMLPTHGSAFESISSGAVETAIVLTGLGSLPWLCRKTLRGCARAKLLKKAIMTWGRAQLIKRATNLLNRLGQ